MVGVPSRGLTTLGSENNFPLRLSFGHGGLDLEAAAEFLGLECVHLISPFVASVVLFSDHAISPASCRDVRNDLCSWMGGLAPELQLSSQARHSVLEVSFRHGST